MTIALKSSFFFLRFWVTGSFNVAIPTLDSREAPYSGPFCEEKQRPEVEGVFKSTRHLQLWDISKFLINNFCKIVTKYSKTKEAFWSFLFKYGIEN